MGGVVRAGTSIYDFNDGTLDGLVTSGDPGFSVSVSGGAAHATDSLGTGNGSIIVATPFTVAGDFTATVIANRASLGGAEFGLGAGDGPTTLDNIFFIQSNAVGANIFRPAFANVLSDANSTQTVKFGLTRTGTTITQFYDDLAGNVVTRTQTDALFAGPVVLKVFLIEEFGDPSAHTGSFDNFTITAAEAPEPGTIGIMIGAATWMLGRRRHTSPLAR